MKIAVLAGRLVQLGIFSALRAREYPKNANYPHLNNRGLIFTENLILILKNDIKIFITLRDGSGRIRAYHLRIRT